MPITAYLLKAVSVFFQYGMLLFLVIFTARLSRAVLQDVRQQPRKIESAQSEGEAVISVIEAPDAALLGRRFAFAGDISIGRGTDNDIVISEQFVSHHHLVILRHQNMYVIKDLDSTNPALLNGTALRGKAYLRNGDKIRVGLVTLQFER